MIKHKPIQIGSPGYVSCSMLGAIFGVSNWKTEADALAIYRGHKEAETDEETLLAYEFGHMMEPIVAHFASKHLNVQFAKKAKRKTDEDIEAWYQDDMPYFICHPDRIIKGLYEDKKTALEIKTTSYMKGWGDEGSDDIPAQYLLQCYGYVACGVCEQVIVVASFGKKFKYYKVVPTPEVVEELRSGVRAWHEKIQDPYYVPLPKSYEELASAYPFIVKDSSIEADLEVYAKTLEIAQLNDQIKDLKDKLDKAKGEVMAYMGSNRLLTREGETIAKISQYERKSFDSKKAIEKYPELNSNEFYKISTVTSLR